MWSIVTTTMAEATPGETPKEGEDEVPQETGEKTFYESDEGDEEGVSLPSTGASEGNEFDFYDDTEFDENEEESVEGTTTATTRTETEYGMEGGEEMMGEHEGGEEAEKEPEKKIEIQEEEMLGEEEGYVEEVIDPAAPFALTDSKEALKAPFELRPDQLEEVKELWDIYQDYTPAYTELKDYVTEVEMVYMLKCLNLQTFTPEQMFELMEFCTRPPHPEHHVEYPHFLHMVTIRQRDMPVEEELRLALEVLDKDNDGIIDRDFFREVLGEHGFKMNAKMLDAFIKEVDVSNDGTIGLEDVVGTVCIDLNRDDIILLQNQINPPPVVIDEEKLENLTS